MFLAHHEIPGIAPLVLALPAAVALAWTWVRAARVSTQTTQTTHDGPALPGKE